MNYLSYPSRQAYLDYVQTLSDEEILLQERNVEALAEALRFDYNLFKSKIYCDFLIKAKNIRSEDNDVAFSKLKTLLKQLFNYSYKTNKSLRKYADFNELADVNSYFDRKTFIGFIEDFTSDISNEKRTGYLNYLTKLSAKIAKHAAVFYCKLTGEYLLDKLIIDRFIDSPKFFLNPLPLGQTCKPDFKYAVGRIVTEIAFDVDYIESIFSY